MHLRPCLALALLLPFALVLTACPPKPPPGGQAKEFRILSINDVYRIEGLTHSDTGGLARVAALRAQLEEADDNLLLLHAGDAFYPSFLSRSYDGEQMVDVLNLMDGDSEAFDERMIATFGNHEFDKSGDKGKAIVQARLDQSGFRWLHSNIAFAMADEVNSVIESEQLADTILIEVGGVQVGLYSTTIDSTPQDYILGYGDPVQTASSRSQGLRTIGAEVVVALTHQSMTTDKQVLTELKENGPDLVIGGHEHVAMEAIIDGRPVYKADEDAVTANLVTVKVGPDGSVSVERELIKLDASMPKDPAVDQVVQGWLNLHSKEFCATINTLDPTCFDVAMPETCLQDEISMTTTDFDAEELRVRGEETSAGNWVADLMRASFPEEGAQIAMINSGSLRLNADIPAGSALERRDVEELFGFSMPYSLLRASGTDIKATIQNGVADWPGNGSWLQVSGMAFVHDTNDGSVRDLTYLGASGPVPIVDEQEYLLVVPDYMAGGGDGNTALIDLPRVAAAPKDLKCASYNSLTAAGAAGISPVVEGRICQVEAGKTTVEGDCLAVSAAP